MKDAVTLPWPGVRSAWAVSMSEIDEGRLAGQIPHSGR